jgi:CBS domain-containing protein
MWWFVLGLFLRHAANMSYQQMIVRRHLEGEPVSRFMHTDVHTVPGDISIRELLDEHVYRHHYKMFPVVDGGHLRGCVTTRTVREAPHEQWTRMHVNDLAEPCSDDNTISPDADAMEALSRMSRLHVSRLLVVDDAGRLRGILTLKDLLAFIRLKVELEDDERLTAI